MNSKDRVLRLVQLERELRAIDDSRLAALIAGLPAETAEWITTIINDVVIGLTLDGHFPFLGFLCQNQAQSQQH